MLGYNLVKLVKVYLSWAQTRSVRSRNCLIQYVCVSFHFTAVLSDNCNHEVELKGTGNWFRGILRTNQQVIEVQKRWAVDGRVHVP